MEESGLCLYCFEERKGAAVCPHCGWQAGAEVQLEGELPPGTELPGGYVVGRRLGRGGFGIIYLAWDRTFQRKRAIKEFFPQGVVTRFASERRVSVVPGQKDFYAKGIKSYLDEARRLARVEEHEAIVSPRAFFEANGTAYLVMDFLEGETLHSYVKRQGGTIPFSYALYYLDNVMDALAAVHEAGILHRDVSPDNVFLTVQGQAKLLDFGAARQQLPEHSEGLSVILREHYAPPEQYTRRGEQGPWTDTYAVAATFYWSITGRSVPPGPDRLLNDELVPPSQLGAELPPAAEEALMWALAVRVEQRPQRIRELRDALQEATQAEAVHAEGAVESPEPEPVVREPLSRRLAPLGSAIGGSALGAASVAGGAVSWLGGAVAGVARRAASLGHGLAAIARSVRPAVAFGVVGVGALAGLLFALWARVGGGPEPPVELPPVVVVGPSEAMPDVSSPAEPPPGKLAVIIVEEVPPPAPEAVPQDLAVPDAPPAPVEAGASPGSPAAPETPAVADEPPAPGLDEPRVGGEAPPAGPAGPPLAALAPPPTAQLVIRSNVSGDRVMIDGRRVGSTGPHAHDLEPGRHVVRVEKPGFKPFETEFVLEAGLEPRIVWAPLERTAVALPVVGGSSARALAALEQRARSDDPEAQEELGARYAAGRGVPADDAVALRWYRRAAGNGRASAQYNLGARLEQGRWYPALDAGATGGIIARFIPTSLAGRFERDLTSNRGEGRRVDEPEAFGWYERAANQDHPSAQTRLGYMYAAGRGVATDNIFQSFHWFERAAVQGVDVAQYNVGMMYLLGLGKRQSGAEARRWLARAAAQGHEGAREQLDEL